MTVIRCDLDAYKIKRETPVLEHGHRRELPADETHDRMDERGSREDVLSVRDRAIEAGYAKL